VVNDEGLRSPKAIAIIFRKSNPKNAYIDKRLTSRKRNPSENIEFFQPELFVSRKTMSCQNIKNEV
jgi:hypothetical protein